MKNKNLFVKSKVKEIHENFYKDQGEYRGSINKKGHDSYLK